ncbi:Glycolipid 2-alpha-mannosyltransferase family protein [Candida albicans]|uniref:Glycolipid 2-alpha-mannosyltransferase family protein n=1 Tax=Candida albicans TaxID=5476 RepID=A0A8H6C3Y9_CANAX|nr:Glycolipid 2-alpha-mannosyltransferase family protein [Candida albicans]
MFETTYLKYLAIILTTITIYVLTHSSYSADPNINDVTTKPISETVPQPPPQSPSSPEQQQQQPANQDQIVKVPEELKNKPQDLVVDNNKDQKPAVSGVPKSSSSSPQQQEKQDTKKESENSSSSKDPVKSEKVKATFVTLARNSELYDLIKSIRNVEDRFNRKFNYDWVFLNDDDFTQEFKDLTTALVSGKTKYGKIPKEHWSYPDWIDLKRAEETRKNMKLQKIIYGDSESYRHMCRFESGFFWRHPLLDDYDWYWRVEPSIDIHCDLNYDLFKYMEDNNKVYGFTISIHEFRATIPTLWDTTKKFIKEILNI